MRAIILAACLALAACGGSPGGRKKQDIPEAVAPGHPPAAVITPAEEAQPVVALYDGDSPLWPWLVLGSVLALVALDDRRGRP